MKTKEADVRIMGILFTIEYAYYPEIPAKLTGRPELCDEGEPELVEIISAKLPLCATDLFPLVSKQVAIEMENAIKNHEHKQQEG